MRERAKAQEREQRHTHTHTHTRSGDRTGEDRTGEKRERAEKKLGELHARQDQIPWWRLPLPSAAFPPQFGTPQTLYLARPQ